MKVVIAGDEVDLGVTEVSPTIGITDYSRRETDEFGITTVVQRGFARRMSVRFALPFAEADALQQRLAALRATPTRWIADGRFEWLDFEGFYKDFQIDLALPPTSFCTLTVEGLTETETVADGGGDPAPDGQSSSLQLLQPVTVGDAELTSSSVSETDHAQWSAITTYPLGARVLKAPTHRIYESVADGNVGNDPLGASGKWIDIGPTNRWAMFDQALGTTTTAVGLVAVTLDVTGVDAVALLDSTATSVRVQAAGYDRTQAVGPGSVTFLDMPLIDGPVTVTIEAPGALSVGTLLVGRIVSLGVTEASPTAGINDFSRKEFDDFGEPTVVERAWAKRMSTRALIRTDAIDQVANRIAAVRARPSLWLGDAEVDALVVYGFFRDFSIEVGETVSTVSLSIEGLSKSNPPTPYVQPPYPGATPGAPDGSPIGGTLDPETGVVTGGRSAEGVLVQIDTTAATALGTAADLAALHEQVEEAAEEVDARIDAAEVEIGDALASIDGLDRARIAGEAATRQLDRQISEGADALLRTVVEGWRTRRRMRDAGITVDPETGIVSIRAVEDTRERLSDAEIRLNAAENSILLRATTTYVDEQIALAVIDPSQIPELGGLQVRVGAAEVAISGLTASLALKANAATLDALSLTVTDLGTQYDALAGTITTKADISVVTALDARVGSVETVIETLGDVSSITTVIRQARFVAEDSAEATLRGLLAQHAAGKLRRKQIAEVRSEAIAKIDEGVSAMASRTESLTAEVDAAQAAIITEQTARVEGDHASATAIGSVAAALAALESDVAAEVARLDTAVVTEAAARAAAILAISVEVDGVTADLDAAVTSLQEAIADETSARASAVSGLNARIDGVEGDLSAAITSLEEAIADEAGARASAVATLSAAVDGIEADLVTINTALVNLETGKASVSSVTSLQTRMGAAEAEIVTVAAVAADAEGIAKATWGFKMTVDGKVSGAKSENDGELSTIEFTQDVFKISGAPGEPRFEFSDGHLRVLNAAGTMIVRLGVW